MKCIRCFKRISMVNRHCKNSQCNWCMTCVKAAFAEGR